MRITSKAPTGIESLRRAVNLFDNCRESFNEQYSADDLLKLYSAYRVCGWDITPDEWTERQLSDALRGRAPQWDANGKPVYGVRVKGAKP